MSTYFFSLHMLVRDWMLDGADWTDRVEIVKAIANEENQ